MASTLSTPSLRTAASSPAVGRLSRGAAQVARVVPNKKALSYDASWKKVWVMRRAEERARAEGGHRGRAQRGAKRDARAPPLLSLALLSLSTPHQPPPLSLSLNS